MKNVFSTSSEIMHLYANKTQPSATNQSRNAFFQRSSLYSYGYHYKLAYFLDGGAILINDSGYSVTTSKHIGEISQASRHKKQFFSTSVLLNEVLRQIENLLVKLPKAKSRKLEYIATIKSLFNSFQNFQKYVKENKIEFIEWSNGELLRAQIDKRSKEYKRLLFIAKNMQNLDILENEVLEEKQRKDKKEATKQRQMIKAYREGKNNFVRLDYDLLSLRYTTNEEGKEYARKDLTCFVHTSQNVKLSLEEGQKIISSLEALQYNEELINKHLKGAKIGYYTLNKAQNNALHIGCHSIKFEEIKKLKKSINKIINLI
tara:strand:- start:526 stop:1476 length:951 start_codon:yes stop_codon:yes gene_type:complete